jgi:hypothetical protein
MYYDKTSSTYLFKTADGFAVSKDAVNWQLHFPTPRFEFNFVSEIILKNGTIIVSGTEKGQDTLKLVTYSLK